MGSFNTTCFASMQTIVPETETYIFPIQQETTYNKVKISKENKVFKQFGPSHSTTSPTAFWSYCGPLIKGKYDDYGRFILNDDEQNQINLEDFFFQLSSKIFVTHEGENTSHDLPLNFSTLYSNEKTYSFNELVKIWNSLWEVSQEQRLFVADYDGNPCSLNFAVMAKRTADYLINYKNNQTDWKENSIDMKTVYFSFIEPTLNKIEKIIQELKEITDKTAQEHKKIFLDFAIMDMANMRNLRINDDHISTYYNLENISEIVKEHIGEDGLEDIDILKNKLFNESLPVLEHIYLNSALSDLNIKLIPNYYADQDYHNEMGDLYKNMIIAVNKEIKKDIKEKYEDDFDDEEQHIILKFKSNNEVKGFILNVAYLEEWKDEITQSFNEKLTKNQKLTLSVGDKCFDFSSVEDVMSNLEFSILTEEEYNNAISIFGKNLGMNIEDLELLTNKNSYSSSKKSYN